MFLSRSSEISNKDGDALGKACSADVKKNCGTIKAGDGYVRRLMYCLRNHEHDLSAGCRDAIKKMRHEKDGDDACAGACACGQTCQADDDEHHNKGKDGGNSLTAVTASNASHDARDDDDHEDEDLHCVGACPAGMANCHGHCVDFESDPLNCGYCDNQCEGKLGDPCVKRQCQKACKGKPGLTDCGEACVDTKTDANNCGACGLACGCDQVCANSKCVPAGPACPGLGGACGVDADCCDPQFPFCTATGCSDQAVGLRAALPEQ
jgi:hypothetical protein